MSVVLTPAATSASTTMTKIVNPLGTSAVSTFEDSYHRKIGYATGFAGVGKITVAKQARLLLSAQDESVSLWKIAERKKDHVSEEETEEEEVGAGWEKVLEMDLNMHTNIVACDISDNGKWISIADWYETKLFYLEKTVSSYMLHLFIYLSRCCRHQARSDQRGSATSVLPSNCRTRQNLHLQVLLPSNSLPTRRSW